MSSKVRAVVAGHGEFASGLVSAVDQITGHGSAFLALTNRGLSGEDILAQLTEAVEATAASVIFTDLPAGSWTVAARRIQRERPALIVVTAVSLPVLLDYVFQSDADPANAAKHAVEKGHGALTIVGVPGAR
jgi:mannose/fructose-specific phosphotransferase system component IIA